MKVLILTITAGEGHNATAAAIRDALSARGADCDVLDAYLKTSRALYNIIAKGYLLTTSDFRKLYANTYARLERRKSNSFKPSLTRTSYAMIARRIYQYILKAQPDVIVYTHVFAGMLLDVIRQRKGLPARTVGVLTDFAMHPFWEEVLRTDRVVIPSDLILPAARRKGLTTEQIVPIGIPIRPQFDTSLPPEEARRQLGLDPACPTVLLMGGSMGYGNLSGIITEMDEMEEHFQIIAVCGNNKKAKEEIDALSLRKTVLTLGYTENISLLMDASDCIVSKPGGLTTSEALVKRLPMIICNPIPGQEDRNAEFLLNNGAAMKVSPTVGLTDILHQFFHSPERARLMRASIDLIRKPNATSDLSDLIFSPGAQPPHTFPETNRGASHEENVSQHTDPVSAS